VSDDVLRPCRRGSTAAAYLFSSLKTSSTSLKLTIFFSFCDLRKISAMDVRMMGTLPGLFNSLLAPTRILKSPKSLLLAHNGRRRSAGNGWSTENRNDSVQQHAAKNAAMRHLSAIVGSKTRCSPFKNLWKCFVISSS
jgi:hypothetical protein